MNKILFCKYFVIFSILMNVMFLASCATTTPKNDNNKKWNIENTNEKEDDSEYYVSKGEFNGALCPYCRIKNEKTFDKMFITFIMDSFGFSKYEVPNISKIKNSFVSVEYIKNTYPALYIHICTNDETVRILRTTLDENEYFIWCPQSSDIEIGYVSIFYRYENNLYFNYLAYQNNGATWFYTRELLEIMSLKL